MATTGPIVSVQRRINFYKVDAGDNAAGKPLPFDPVPGLAHIKSLPFDPDPILAPSKSRYLQAGDGLATCVWPEPTGTTSRVRIGNIRRSGLPQCEKKGALTAIPISTDSGLAEQTHIVFFPGNIAGVEFNFHGPRINRFCDYYNAKCVGVCPPISFEALFRRDVIEQLERMKGIRVFDLKIRASDVDLVGQVSPRLARALDAAAGAGQAEEVEIVLRATRNGFLPDMMESVRKMLTSSELLDRAKKCKIAGVEEQSGNVRVIDFLSDYIVAKKSVLKEDPRLRSVNSNSAYAAIEEAYKELRDELIASARVRADVGSVV